MSVAFTEAVGVVALSARMMAESARDGGFSTTAIDVFGDRDTRAASNVWRSAGDPQSLRIQKDRVLRALEAFGREPGAVGWIAGGGFEAAIDVLAQCSQVAPLLGNTAETFKAVRTPREFFAQLPALGIDAPEVAWERPANARDWLVKDAHGSGGWHIRAAADDRRSGSVGTYFQRVHAGVPMSALFVANGREARVIGINALIVARRGAMPYVYHGAIGPVPLSEDVAQRLTAHIDAIACAWRLVGLNGIDFLLDNARIVVLEVNPRPTGTIMLHDDAVPRGLIRAHVDACRFGRLPDVSSRNAARRALRGHAIVFAEHALTMTPVLQDALVRAGCIHDIPTIGTATGAGDPLCSVSARGETIESVRAQLTARTARVIERARPRPKLDQTTVGSEPGTSRSS